MTSDGDPRSTGADPLGRVARGVGHELLNQLAIISGRMELLGARLEAADPRTTASMGDVATAAQRAQGLVRRLVALSVGPEGVVGDVDAHACLTDAAALVQPGLPRGVAIALEPSSGRADAWADRGALLEALVHLLLFAGSVVGEPGTIGVGVDAGDTSSALCASCGDEVGRGKITVVVRIEGSVTLAPDVDLASEIVHRFGGHLEVDGGRVVLHLPAEDPARGSARKHP